ncbi:MAG: M13 family metallopeptidase, partial [Actinomycetota bacterium]
VTRFFQLLGRKPAAAARAAADVMSLESEIAKLTMSQVDRREPSKIYNPTTVTDLVKLAPAFDWSAWLAALGNPTLDHVVLTNPAFFAGVSGLMKTIKPSIWASYLEWRTVRPLADALPSRFAEEAFQLTKLTRGLPEQPVRWKRCVAAVNTALPQYLGQPFVDQAFPGESKQSATEMVGAIRRALSADIAGLSWMTEATKEQAQLKLKAVGLLIGYPDTWREYDFAIDRTTYAANMMAATLAETRRQFARAGQKVDRDEWLMPPQIVNAYYNPNANNTALPAGILQPPFFGKDRLVAANLGGIGMVVGHELTHGFDDQGAQFDEIGNQRDWWQEADKKGQRKFPHEFMYDLLRKNVLQLDFDPKDSWLMAASQKLGEKM